MVKSREHSFLGAASKSRTESHASNQERLSINIKTTGVSGQGGAPVFHPCETGSLLHANFRSIGDIELAARYAATSLESEKDRMEIMRKLCRES